MKKQINLIAAPTMIQPGGYVPKAYADRAQAQTPHATVETIQGNNTLKIILEWENKHPAKSMIDDVDAFVDSAAILAAEKDGASWVSMGSPDSPISGALWRADKKEPIHISAKGLGSVQRSDAPPDWQVSSEWDNNHWRVEFLFTRWEAINTTKQFAFAIWSGHNAERGGLKSLSPGWLTLTDKD